LLPLVPAVHGVRVTQRGNAVEIVTPVGIPQDGPLPTDDDDRRLMIGGVMEGMDKGSKIRCQQRPRIHCLTPSKVVCAHPLTPSYGKALRDHRRPEDWEERPGQRCK